MTPKPCVIDESLTLADAMDRMLANNIRHLVVVSNEQAVGIVDAADLGLISGLWSESPREITVKKAKRPLFQCSSTAPVTEVVRTMENHHYTCAVIVDEGHVVGIFTLTDALRALRQLAMGRPVEPEVEPTHRPQLAPEREKTPPRVHARSMLHDRGASPSASDGLAFGTVGL